MRYLASAVLGTLLLGGVISAAPQAPKKAEAVRCTLTHKEVDKCCCQQRDGKLYCPLAKKTIQTCCCEPAAGKATAPAKAKKS